MLVDDFLDEIGDILQEDFTYAVLWTKAELLKMLRSVLREFSSRTLIADKHKLRIVNSTTGESSLPEDFNQAYYTSFDQTQVDITQLGDLDFDTSGWLSGVGSSTVRTASIIGSGTDGVIRYSPVPSSVATGVEGCTTSLGIKDSGDNVWLISTDEGVITTTVDAGEDPADYSTGAIYSCGDGNTYQITIDTSGILSSTLSYDDSVYYMIEDDTYDTSYHHKTRESGVLYTHNYAHGLTVRIDLDSTNQTMDQDYGVLCAGFVGSPGSASTDAIYVSGPIGTTIHGLMTENTGYLWYKGMVQDVETTYSELFMYVGFRTVVLHGVLARAYGKDGDGQDLKKSDLLQKIFEFECDMIKRVYQRRK
jgi:hypothetical protein